MNSSSIAVVMIVVLTAGSLHGQDHVRGHVFLPQTAGATVLSTYIDAEARRAVAIGDFLESAALARRINLESDQIAMKNSVLWVETYFEKRKLNREYRDAEHPSYLESKRNIAEQKHKRIVNAAPMGDPTDELNFMLNGLQSDATAYKAVFLSETPRIEAVDLDLHPTDLPHILLKEMGGSAGGRTHRPSDPKMVSTGWPRIFLRPEFDAARAEYDQARKSALAEIADCDLSVLTLEALQASLRRLEVKFDEIYSRQRMKDKVDIATFILYRDMGENFLRAQAAGTLRAFAVKNADAFSSDLRFDGETMIDLLRHCSEHNLMFANPESGDETTYSRLYQQLRQLYLAYVSEQPVF